MLPTSSNFLKLEDNANLPLGSEGSVGWQGDCLSCWRLTRATFCRRSWPQRIEDLDFRMKGIGLYQQLLECTVDIPAILTGGIIFPLSQNANDCRNSF